MSQISQLVRLMPTGTGKKSLIIPETFNELLANSDYATITRKDGGLLIRPADTKRRKP